MRSVVIVSTRKTRLEAAVSFRKPQGAAKRELVAGRAEIEVESLVYLFLAVLHVSALSCCAIAMKSTGRGDAWGLAGKLVNKENKFGGQRRLEYVFRIAPHGAHPSLAVT